MIKFKGTLWEEFLSHTSGLLEQGDHIASFRNYANRYFENLGQHDSFVRANTQRAMGLILGNLDASHSAEDVLQRIRIGASGVRSPEWTKANSDVASMFAAGGDSALLTKSALAEAGHLPDQMGLMDFADSLMSGKLTADQVDVLPEPAARLVFETAKDAANILGVVTRGNARPEQGNLECCETGVT